MRTDHAVLRAAASDLVTAAIGAAPNGWNPAPIVPRRLSPTQKRAARRRSSASTSTRSPTRFAPRCVRSSRNNAHPDHGGDGVYAAELISAQNLLLARARERRCDDG